ncbi:acyl transferase [Aureitalea sp. L0-47]|uniref:LuxE/PaaK family acyltransferase n=1 Tax=Aureitalea sp. L0-47 TaxID=2816962 RepID=UPI002238E3F9|nr:acyl transferase [Aureitalea sp. L0-47]MCW5518445.1 acyl transferase [Aureitalea sp. L0-47]
MDYDAIFSITSPEAFERKALETFRYQYDNVAIYRNFCDAIKTDVSAIKEVKDIPFLPIQFFTSERVLARELEPQITFSSSGTTGSTPAKHFVAHTELYRQSFMSGFRRNYGQPSEYAILALLPSYLERKGSSLVYMVDHLIEASEHAQSGFYLDDLVKLAATLSELEASETKTLLIGVSFALLNLVEKHKFNLRNTVVMETGGMKGRRKEIIREELHSILKKGFGLDTIHSEYGMTELLSQAYSKGDGVFSCPPWMKVLTRDPEDPFTYIEGKTGGINVIDLANQYSCSFIATQDLGKMNTDGNFEILGRFDTSDIRGCNLMAL